jgi:hypothetical protein
MATKQRRSSVRDPLGRKPRAEPSENRLIIERLGKTLPALFNRQSIALVPPPTLFVSPLIERIERLAKRFFFATIAACHNPGLKSLADIRRKLI